MQNRWLFRITYLYLVIPFILFSLGWLRLFIGVPIAALMIWILWRLWNNRTAETESSPSRITYHALLITGLWLLLSGVGGYAFQNWDHHWRNAVFRDLIANDWPVYYSQPESGPVRMLVYYVGYWLPAALTGKLLGWKFANFILFLWTWLGVLLVISHLSLKLKTSSFKASLLLILFSGMDALGALFFAQEYPTLWPPVQHLEIWLVDLQYSSFTTQLFWVFNQAVPAWLCLSMFITLREHRAERRANPEVEAQRPKSLMDTAGDSSLPKVAQNDIIGKTALLWSLCFFFAPLASIGLLPYLLVEWMSAYRKFKQDADERRRTQNNRSETVKSARISVPKEFLTSLRFDVLLAGAVLFLVSYLFFSSNSAAQESGFQVLPLKAVLIFFLLEGGILWLVLASRPRLWRDPRWIVTGILLFIIPFIQLGSGRDFVMRASIAPLFYLMLMTGETLLQASSPRILRITIYVLLLLGALTPLFEINRSVYRTVEYYFILSPAERVQPRPEPITHLPQGIAPEVEHPGALIADDIQTLRFMDDLLSKNFIANVRQTLYYRYIAPH